MTITVWSLIPVFESVAAEVPEVSKLLASDGAAGDNFGVSVAIFGDAAVVGASNFPYSEDEHEAAYVFRNNGEAWAQEAKLTGSGAEPGDEFGGAVAISGDTIAIGAPFAGSDDGAVYVFRDNGSAWVQEANLGPSNVPTGDQYFGAALAVSGDAIVVGSWKWFGDEWAFVFRFNGSNWVEEAKLEAFPSRSEENFGASVAISGNTAVIGAPDQTLTKGMAYVFRYDGTWHDDANLTAAFEVNQPSYLAFGTSVAISDDVVVVGATRDDDNGSNSGSAYVFRDDGSGVWDGSAWTQEAKLTASDGAAWDYFGESVAVSDDTILVGTGNGSKTYVFQYNGTAWVEETIFTASGGGLEDSFGGVVALSGDSAVTGAAWDIENGSGAGAAYVFSVPEPACALLQAAALLTLLGLKRRRVGTH